MTPITRKTLPRTPAARVSSPNEHSYLKTQAIRKIQAKTPTTRKTQRCKKNSIKIPGISFIGIAHYR